jgi:CheY-like chemotaxis protein
MPDHPLVLAADDEDICLSITKKMLEQLGFSVIAVKNGREAVAIYRQQNDKILFILLDIHMPLMDGVQASKQIKNISRNAQLVFVSGETNDDLNDEVEALHPLAILKKPISFNELSLVLIGARKTNHIV